MELSELKTALDATGYPVAYHHFEEAQELPFIVYLESETSNFLADNTVYEKVRNIEVELYTDKKDLAAEAAIEAVFKANELPWQAAEFWIESEKLYQRIYEIGVD